MFIQSVEKSLDLIEHPIGEIRVSIAQQSIKQHKNVTQPEHTDFT